MVVEIDSEILTGDKIVVATIPGPTGAGVEFTSSIEITASDVDSFVVSREGVRELFLFTDGFESGDTSAWSSTSP